MLALASGPSHAQQFVEIAGARDVLAYFDEIGYTPAAWKAGIREVPRVYLANVPSRWKQAASQELTVVEKKQIFFHVIAPIVLYVNEEVLAARTRALPIAERIAAGKDVPPSDLAWFGELSRRYRVSSGRDGTVDAAAAAELIRRVDVVPPSLALAQAASESGWGTSRFADEGNALFGQWAWSEGLRPAGQRSADHGDHRVAAFDSTYGSVEAYVRNLNTHDAYTGFRERREALRRAHRPVRGSDLVGSLDRYSERGEAYVEDLRTIMRQNQLDAVDDAHLKDVAIIRLEPTGHGID